MNKQTALEYAGMVRDYWQERNPYASIVKASEIIAALEGTICRQAEEEGWYSELSRFMGYGTEE